MNTQDLIDEGKADDSILNTAGKTCYDGLQNVIHSFIMN